METKSLEVGSQIRVRAWGGIILTRRVLAVREDTVSVCSEEEYQRAKKEEREPMAIGFKLRNVIEASSIGAGRCVP